MGKYLGVKKTAPVTCHYLSLEEERDNTPIPQSKNNSSNLSGKKMAGRSEKNRKHKQRQSGKDQRQSWIWERSGELANEGDTGCSDTVLSPGTRP